MGCERKKAETLEKVNKLRRLMARCPLCQQRSCKNYRCQQEPGNDNNPGNGSGGPGSIMACLIVVLVMRVLIFQGAVFLPCELLI